MPDSDKITRLLGQWRAGSQTALDELMPVVYDELHRRARNYMRAENPDHTLQPTALINEAYLRLVDQKNAALNDRAHFFAVASQIIRHILVDHARSKHRLKRGGFILKAKLNDDVSAPESNGVDLLDIDEALERLTALDPRHGRIVELRFYGGLSIEETAEAMAISPATVKREWSVARLWLHQELTK